MGENILSSLFRKGPEVRKNGDFHTEIYGQPKPEVIAAAEQARRLVLEEMGFSGPPPKMKIAEGHINDRYAGECAGIYEFSTGTVAVGQGKLQGLLSTDSGSVPDEALAALVIAEETAHYVQDKQGRLPHTPYIEGSETADEHYQIHDYETEAGRISVRIANRLFPQVGFSRRHQGIDE